MADNNNPAASPAQPGQAPGQAQMPANNTPAAGANAAPNGGNDNSKIEMDAAEAEALKRDAGRWKKYQQDQRENRRNNRTNRPSNSYEKLDGAAPEVLEALRSKDELLDTLSLEKRELAVKDKVRDLFESDEYKGLPISVKKAIIRNPLGFVNRSSETIEDAVADIQDYLDEELDNGSANNNQPPATPPAQEQKTHQIPPAGGSGPASPNSTPDADVANKVGPARSTAIISNLLKNRGNKA